MATTGDLKPLDRYLKGCLNAHPGDTVRVEFLSDTEEDITLI